LWGKARLVLNLKARLRFNHYSDRYHFPCGFVLLLPPNADIQVTVKTMSIPEKTAAPGEDLELCMHIEEVRGVEEAQMSPQGACCRRIS
jgi:hypothetical protein